MLSKLSAVGVARAAQRVKPTGGLEPPTPTLREPFGAGMGSIAVHCRALVACVCCPGTGLRWTGLDTQMFPICSRTPREPPRVGEGEARENLNAPNTHTPSPAAPQYVSRLGNKTRQFVGRLVSYGP